METSQPHNHSARKRPQCNRTWSIPHQMGHNLLRQTLGPSTILGKKDRPRNNQCGYPHGTRLHTTPHHSPLPPISISMECRPYARKSPLERTQNPIRALREQGYWRNRYLLAGRARGRTQTNRREVSFRVRHAPNKRRAYAKYPWLEQILCG